MSTRINTNVDAFTAQRNLSMTATTYSKSVQKLSSGLRINSAADDAAGLAISEKLADTKSPSITRAYVHRGKEGERARLSSLGSIRACFGSS